VGSAARGGMKKTKQKEKRSAPSRNSYLYRRASV